VKAVDKDGDNALYLRVATELLDEKLFRFSLMLELMFCTKTTRS
jgi:hypothetical protein